MRTRRHAECSVFASLDCITQPRQVLLDLPLLFGTFSKLPRQLRRHFSTSRTRSMMLSDAVSMREKANHFLPRCRVP